LIQIRFPVFLSVSEALSFTRTKRLAHEQQNPAPTFNPNSTNIVMKHPSSLSLAALLCTAGFALADTPTPVYTTPVGYETIDLPAGIEYQITGLRLQKPAISIGAVTDLSDDTFTDDDTDFDELLTPGVTYILEITNGTANGVIQEIVEWGVASGNTINDLVVVTDLQTLGVQVGDSYKLRPAPILEELFDTSNLTPGFSSAQADLVWVPDGVGGYDRYFISALVGNPWRNVATGLNAPNVPIIYQDGLLIQKRATSPATSLTVSGEVKASETIAVLNAGTPASPSYNLIGTVYPAGSTIQNSNITSGLVTGFSVAQADLIWVPDGSGGFVKYFVSSLVGNPLKNAATGLDVTTPVPLTPGILIERKGAAINLLITPPTSYQNF